MNCSVGGIRHRLYLQQASKVLPKNNNSRTVKQHDGSYQLIRLGYQFQFEFLIFSRLRTPCWQGVATAKSKAPKTVDISPDTD